MVQGALGGLAFWAAGIEGALLMTVWRLWGGAMEEAAGEANQPAVKA